MEIGSGDTRPLMPRPDARSRGAQTGGPGPLHQFFATASAPCPYVPGRIERKLIVELPAGHDATVVYDHLSRAGFRRSHHFAYRPACRACTACVPVRIAVDRFADTRSTRRVRGLNRTLRGGLVAARATVEQYQLFAMYQRSRHASSEMAAMSYRDYRHMVEDSPVTTAIAEFRDTSGALVAAALIDRLDDGISAVYSYFDPGQARQSLGTWSILWLVDESRRQGLPHVYLGYWIGESPKMAYKARFPAVEKLSPRGWVGLGEPG